MGESETVRTISRTAINLFRRLIKGNGQRMAHTVVLGTVEGAYSKRRRDSVCRRTRTGANTGACLSQE